MTRPIMLCSMCSNQNNPKIGMMKCHKCREMICRECAIEDGKKLICIKCNSENENF